MSLSPDSPLFLPSPLLPRELFGEVTLNRALKEVEDEERLAEQRRQRAAELPKPDIDDPAVNRWLSWRLDAAEKVINDSTGGNLHSNRIKAARLIGGLVPQYLCYDDALSMLSGWVTDKTEHWQRAEKDLMDGVKYGMKDPLFYDPQYSNPVLKIALEQKEGGDMVITFNKKPDEDGVIYEPDLSNIPDIMEPLITFNGIKILTRGNIALMTAGAGLGKSNIEAAKWASAYGSFDADTLGFKVAEGCKVWFIDTEMSREDTFYTYKRALSRVGITRQDEKPSTMRWVNIRGLDLVGKQNYVWGLMEGPDCPDILFLDGIGDLVKDVNNPDETTETVTKLCQIVHNKKIGVSLTLHGNPKDMGKARGHLGSELWRKCESNLTIEKQSDEKQIRKITTEFEMGKNRGNKDSLIRYYTWDDTAKMHVSCNSDEVAISTAPSLTVDYKKILAAIDTGTIYRHVDLVKIIMEQLHVAERTAKTRIADLVALQKIFKTENGYYKAGN